MVKQPDSSEANHQCLMITHAELATHNSETDCWVAVHGGVFDVSKFLPDHPGGIAALSKFGRAGCDVTSHFERIGHSAAARERLASLRIGTLVEEDGDKGTEHLGNDDHAAHEHAVEWHGRRRRLILEAHPEIAALAGDNPWTPLIGIFVSVLHAWLCLLASTLDFWSATALAYTLGALCKMYQFAVCHEICHGVAGPLVRPRAPKHIALSLLTLPSIGGEMQHYYSIQHIGHHASLGAWPALEQTNRIPAPETREEAAHDLEEADAAFFGPECEDADRAANVALVMNDPDVLRAKAAAIAAAEASLRSLQSLEEYDGDLPSPGSMLLLAGTSPLFAQASANIRAYMDGLLKADADGSPSERSVVDRLRRLSMRWVDPLGWRARALLLSPYQAVHLLFLLLPFHIFFGVVANPLTCLALWMLWAVPDAWWLRSADATLRFVWRMRADERAPRLRGVDVALASLATLRGSPRVVDLAAQVLGIGLHTWAWVGTLWLLLVVLLPQDGSAWMGLFYLTLSELCLHGFGFHPYLGFFLGVHRSRRHAGAAGSPPPPDCQPTMSTYSRFAAIASLNLSFHVEHHDFPNVPWSRLSEIRRIAPEFYDKLDSSPGFLMTIANWLSHGHEYSYACHGTLRLDAGVSTAGVARPLGS